MIAYTARICDPFGQLLAEVANFVDNPQGGGAALDYALTVGGVGALQLTLPASFDARLLPLDGRIGVWRSINGRTPQLDGQTVFFIRTWRYTDTTTTVTAYSANELLRRRIIAYYAGSAFAAHTTPTSAGNLIKDLVSENMGSGISSADRIGAETQADISALLSIQGDLNDGTSLATQCAWRSLETVVRDLCDAATQASNYMAFDIVAPTESTLELRTYEFVRGVDHTASSAQPVILSPQRGSLENCLLLVDRSSEITVGIAAGSGEGTSRLTASSIDTTRMGESPFNRREAMGDYNNVSDAGALQDLADALVRAGRPRTEFTADIVETDGATRGIHYDLGDMVTAEFRGKQYDSRLDVIGVALGGGTQRSTARIRSLT